MELSFRELKKRDVINVIDGACLGRIIDVVLDFPKGELIAIVVPGRRGKGLFGFFNKTDIVIDESKILKIGNDVILVELKCGGGYYPDSDHKKPIPKPPKPNPHPPHPPHPPHNAPCGFTPDDFHCDEIDVDEY